MPTNLDALCASCAQRIVSLSRPRRDKELENRLTNALGVLQEDGFYAFYLFLKYRDLDRAPQGENDRAWPVWPELAALLRDQAAGKPLPAGADDEAVVALTGDLERLLLARQLTERALTYARYGIRSLPG